MNQSAYVNQQQYQAYLAQLSPEPRPAVQPRPVMSPTPPIIPDITAKTEATADPNIAEGIAQPGDWGPDWQLPHINDFKEWLFRRLP